MARRIARLAVLKRGLGGCDETVHGLAWGGSGSGRLTGSDLGLMLPGMGEEKLGRDRPPSPRELATAFGILKGKSTAAAMRDAGYSANTADVKAGRVAARLRALGLLPEPSEARDVVAMMRAVLIEEDDGAALKQAFRTMLARAQSGDVKALRFIMDYLVGRPVQQVTAAGAASTMNVNLDMGETGLVKVYIPDNGRRKAEDEAIAREVVGFLEGVKARKANGSNGAAETPP